MNLKRRLTVIFSIIGLSFCLTISGLISPSFASETSDFEEDLVQEITGDQGWGVVAVDSDTNKVYVTNHVAGTLTVLDGRTSSILNTIELGQKPYGLGMNTDTKILYVAREFDNKLVVVDGSSDKIVTEIELEKPYDIAVNSQTDKVYVTSDGAHFLAVVDGKSNQIEKTFPVKNPCGLAVNEATNKIYVTSESENIVHVFDGNSMEEVTTIDVGKSPRGVAVNPLTNTIYITNQAANTVSVIDGATNTLIDTIDVEDVPRRVVVMPSTNTIYVANQFSNSLSVIDGENNTVKESIDVAKPFELTIDTQNGKIYSSYFQNDYLSIIDVSAETSWDFSSDFINECKNELQENFILAKTDQNHYDRGETILIRGCVKDISHSKGLNIQIMDPDGNIVKSNSLVPNLDGSFSMDYLTDEEFGLDGEYSVMAEFGDYKTGQTFTVPEFGIFGMIVLAAGTSLSVFFFKRPNLLIR